MAAALVAGCGSDDDEPGPGIPSDLVRQISTQLDLIQDRLDVTRDTDKIGSCNDIELKSIPDIETLMTGIPDDTDPEIVDALEQGIARLRELASQECSDLEDQIGQETETTPEETTPQETVTETVPPETTPEETNTEPQQTTPQDNGSQGRGPQGEGPPGQGGGGTVPPADEGDD